MEDNRIEISASEALDDVLAFGGEHTTWHVPAGATIVHNGDPEQLTHALISWIEA